MKFVIQNAQRIAIRLFAALGVCMSLSACPGKSPDKAKAELPEVTIEVLDRFGNPMPDQYVEVKREFSRFMSMQPYEEVADGRSDENGIVIFQNVREGDWVSSSTSDHCFSEEITLTKGKDRYQMKLADARMTSTSYGKDVNPGQFEDDAKRVMSALNKILAHHVKTEQTGFQSPEEYASLGVIGESDARHLVKMGARMLDDSSGINYGWGGFDVRVPGLDEPIVWVDRHTGQRR